MKLFLHACIICIHIRWMDVTQNKINYLFLIEKVLAVSQTGTSVTLDLGFWKGEFDLCLFAKYPGKLKTLFLFESLFVFMMSILSQRDTCVPSLFWQNIQVNQVFRFESTTAIMRWGMIFVLLLLRSGTDLTSSNLCACSSKSRLTCHAYRKQTIARVTKVNMWDCDGLLVMRRSQWWCHGV